MQLIKETITIVIGLLFIVVTLTLNQSKAQSITANNDKILSLLMVCPNNPQCIYSGQNSFPVNTIVINHSDQNLEVPLEIIRYSAATYFQNSKTKKIVGDSVPVGMIIPDTLKNLTLIPAHGSKVMTGNFDKSSLKKAFKETHSNQISIYTWTPMYAHYQGSKEPIGTYKDGKFEPKRLVLEAEIIVTKK